MLRSGAARVGGHPSRVMPVASSCPQRRGRDSACRRGQDHPVASRCAKTTSLAWPTPQRKGLVSTPRLQQRSSMPTSRRSSDRSRPGCWLLPSSRSSRSGSRESCRTSDRLPGPIVIPQPCRPEPGVIAASPGSFQGRSRDGRRSIEHLAYALRACPRDAPESPSAANDQAQPLRVGPGFTWAGFHVTGQGVGENERGGGLECAAELAGGAGRLES